MSIGRSKLIQVDGELAVGVLTKGRVTDRAEERVVDRGNCQTQHEHARELGGVLNRCLAGQDLYCSIIIETVIIEVVMAYQSNSFKGVNRYSEHCWDISVNSVNISFLIWSTYETYAQLTHTVTLLNTVPASCCRTSVITDTVYATPMPKRMFTLANIDSGATFFRLRYIKHVSSVAYRRLGGRKSRTCATMTGPRRLETTSMRRSAS